MWWFNRIALWRAGARARRLCAGNPGPLDDVRGFVIGGGDDIDATLYGGKIEPAIRIDRERDALELELLKYAANRRLPVLGICRGAQMINVFLGGVLHESIYAAYPDLPRLHSPLPSKTIEVAGDSGLFGLLRVQRGRVNALHHQSISVLGAGLRVVARDQFGIVQAIERPGHPFLMGVQWHPEYLVFNRSHQRLFEGLVEAARRVQGRDQGGPVTETRSIAAGARNGPAELESVVLRLCASRRGQRGFPSLARLRL